jgi:hypothetical protein
LVKLFRSSSTLNSFKARLRRSKEGLYTAMNHFRNP